MAGHYTSSQANVRHNLENAIWEAPEGLTESLGPIEGSLSAWPADHVTGWFKMVVEYIFAPRLAAMAENYGFDPLFDLQVIVPAGAKLPTGVAVTNCSHLNLIRFHWEQRDRVTGKLWIEGEEFNLRDADARQNIIWHLRFLLAKEFGDPE